jgi:hypothetical protein
MNRMSSRQPAPAAQVAAQVRRSLDLGEFALARPAVPASAFVGLSIVCVGAMVAASVLSAHDCRVKPIPLTLGRDAEVAITVPAKTSCTIQVHSGSAMVDDLVVTAPPAHGVLTPRGRTGVVYRPDRGFRGDDAFVFSLQGTMDSARIGSTIHVQATVN